MHFFGCTVNFYGLYLQPQKQQGYVAQLNRASDYGSEGYRFESCRGHKKTGNYLSGFFIFKLNSVRSFPAACGEEIQFSAKKERCCLKKSYNLNLHFQKLIPD